MPLLDAFVNVLAPAPMFFIFLGVLLGIVVGAIPGLGGAMLIALLLPVTFYMDSVLALMLLVSIYVGSVSGGLITAIMLKMPGTPSAVMTVLDGHPMAQQGRAGRALSLGIMASFVGGIVSWLFLALLSPPLADFALKFGPYELFTLVLMALVLIATVAEGTLVKGLLIALFGMAVAMVGPDASSGVMRLTFGVDSFAGGFSLLPVLLGVFVISQIIEDVLKKELPIQQQGGRLTEFMPSAGDVRKHGPNAVRSSLIGTWIGVLPGVGSAIAAIVAYTTTKSFSKHPETFGTGEEAGIVAAESSNNASVNGALIPLGIPGSVIDAILIGALVIHNLQPGPLLFTNSPEIAYGVIAAALVANFLMAALMFAGVRPIARIATISRAYLFPTIIVCCVIGVYSLSNSMSSVWVMMVFGVLGFLFRRGGFPVGPFVLGYILAPLAEKELRSGLMLYDGSLMPLVTRPISLFFILLTLVLALWPLVQARIKARQATRSEGRQAARPGRG
ncbi:Tripartite tricarboxylate transporter TctA family protein [Marinovum algicola]|uniref:Tricarboxylic transport membrane protein n=1 Tax=Marinovum algicola TaxID=42444 RepID=A0A975W717_9RHOB|nr:tripartite tricarboxylate transporter permease [Marinovum algicola]SEI66347.1 putative tricarboxylic transport membrane protein [Marinovum algicola]SLN23914.1 Tripartite tricarboxylate transporter TctA family protein [Marinovum algicola]